MGRIKLDSINDFARHGYKVRVSCKCGRKVDWSATELLMRLHARKLPYQVDRLEPKLRCQFCFARGARISPVMPEMAQSNVR